MARTADSGPSFAAARRLSWIVAALLTIVSAGGALLAEQLYRDNALVTQAFKGQDIVTLFVAVPVLVGALLLDRRGSNWGRLCWLAMLSYSAYGYLFYALGAAFNAFFLLYVAIFACSLYALVFSLPRMSAATLARPFRGRVAKWTAIAYMSVSAVGLGLLWTGMSASFWFTGEVPAPVVSSGHPTGVVFALDLSIIVPLMVMGIVQLARGNAWGWVIAAVMSVKGTIYTLGLVVATVVAMRAGVTDGLELPIWVTLTVLGALSLVALVWDSRRPAVAAQPLGTAESR